MSLPKEKSAIIVPQGFKSDSVDFTGDESRKRGKKVRGSDYKKPKPKGTAKERKVRFGRKKS